MQDTVLIDFNLLCTIKRDGKDSWGTGCLALDLFSQGRTEEEAKQCIKEAIELWVEDCLERGTLDAALREVGFHKVHTGAAFDSKTEHLPEHIDTGTFAVHLSIPAYQAAAFLSAPG